MAILDNLRYITGITTIVRPAENKNIIVNIFEPPLFKEMAPSIEMIGNRDEKIITRMSRLLREGIDNSISLLEKTYENTIRRLLPIQKPMNKYGKDNGFKI